MQVALGLTGSSKLKQHLSNSRVILPKGSSVPGHCCWHFLDQCLPKCGMHTTDDTDHFGWCMDVLLVTFHDFVRVLWLFSVCAQCYFFLFLSFHHNENTCKCLLGTEHCFICSKTLNHASSLWLRTPKSPFVRMGIWRHWHIWGFADPAILCSAVTWDFYQAIWNPELLYLPTSPWYFFFLDLHLWYWYKVHTNRSL